jgi:hypothetical protein
VFFDDTWYELTEADARLHPEDKRALAARERDGGPTDAA